MRSFSFSRFCASCWASAKSVVVPLSLTCEGGTTTPDAASTFSVFTWPNPVASEFLSCSNFLASTVDMAKSTMNMHMSTVTMSM